MGIPKSCGNVIAIINLIEDTTLYVGEDNWRVSIRLGIPATPLLEALC
jgi:hypothetical protein